ncbi:hypothetical protein SAMN04487939_107137 [Lysobacter sp. yr284]|uniref:hypothetical protein n=1 Tax=Lysobacter TaxID=68 RepID=UPI000896B76E|nr:hypothetical protein [Lysobacter sp. yr284]SDY87507.1 hypothetical protein SAMN04487939_107137 [Lysobacter sp. yr284]
MRKLSLCLAASLVLTLLTGCYPPPVMNPTADHPQPAPHVELDQPAAPAVAA